jgi:ubiquinone biosynthesis protein
VDEFEAAVRTVCEPIFARPISEISFGQLVLRLFQVARRFDMPVQPQLVLLQKTLLNIEGLGRQLYPQLDLWETAKPYLEQWMKDQIGPKALMKTLRRELPSVLPLIPELPGLVHELLRRQRDGQDLVSSAERDRTSALEEKLAKRTQQKNRLAWGVIFLMAAIANSTVMEIYDFGMIGTAVTAALTGAGVIAVMAGIFGSKT